MPLQPRIKCYVTIPGTGEVEFHPLNDSLVLSWHRENDIWRKKLNTGILVSNHGGVSLYDIMAQMELEECGCDSLPMRLALDCPLQDEETLFTGNFVFIDGEWNFDTCTAEIEPRTEDPFTCLFRVWDVDKNILDIEDNVALSTDLGTFQTVECAAFYEDESWPGDPVRFQIYEDDCLASLPGGDWSVLSHEISSDLPDPENPDPTLFVYTSWTREVFNGAGPPAGSGWTQVSPTFWTRKPILQGPTIVNHPGTFWKATWEVQSKTLDNGRLLSDVLAFLANDCPYPFQSDFLGINADNTAPPNDAYDHAAEWLHGAVVFSMSDVVKNDASENATVASVSLKDLWADLKVFGEMFMFFDYETNSYRIEHVSYDRYSRLINLVAHRPDAIRGYNSYTYDKVRMPKKEVFEWDHKTTAVDWDNASIVYSICSDDQQKIHKINKFHTDFGSLVGSALTDIDKLKGLMLVAQFQGQIKRGIGAISGELVANAGLSWANMVREVWKWLRPECSGMVNGVPDVTFASLMYKIKQKRFSFDMGCSCKDVLKIDPNIDKVRTGLGTGIFDDIQIDLGTLMADVGILHAPPIELVDEEIIIPEINIVVNDDFQCYYTDFIFSLDVDLNDSILVEWNFGVGAVPLTATGEGPHTVQYTTAGVKTVTVTATYESQVITDSITVTVITCPGNIVGKVEEIDGIGIQGVNVRLFPDANLDGISDGGAPIRNVNTNSNGIYSMATLTPGHYVIVLTMPPNYTMISAEDEAPDGDLGPDLSLTDNVIPCTITPSKLDVDNKFYLQYDLGIVKGTVMVDPSTPFFGANVRVYKDFDLDGVEDDAIIVSAGVTNAMGEYTISGIPVGEYIIRLEVPPGYQMVSAQDDSPDGDLGPDPSPTDNKIPVTITYSKTDTDNNFIIEPI